MRKKLLMLAGGLCFSLGMSTLQAQQVSDNLQVYVFDPEQIEQWFGVNIYGVSDNGKYAVGFDDTFSGVAVIWDMDSREFRQITGSYKQKAEVYDVSDNGVAVGVFADNTLEETKTAMVPGYWKDGKWTALPLTEGIPIGKKDVNGCARTISPDGTIITGYVKDWFYWEKGQKNVDLCRPAVWINGVLQPMYDEVPSREGLGIGMGMWPNYASADGRVLGGLADHPTGARSPAVWIDGEMTRIYGEKDVDPDVDEFFYDGVVGGVSPNGKYVTGYFAPQGDGSVLIPFIYNTETKEKEELKGSWGSTTAVLDDGTVYGMSGYMGEALLRTSDYEGTLMNYLIEKYGIEKDDLECPFFTNVGAVSADGSVIGGYFAADAGFGAGMLPYLIVMGHPTSIQTAQNAPALRLEGQEIIAEGADKIELFDVSGCKLTGVAGAKVSVSGLSGVIIAKAYYANGETGHAKFVIR